MAYGLGQSGGLQDPPLIEGVGFADWATMTSMDPGHALVGGSSGMPGLGSLGQRQVAVAMADPQSAAASGSPVAAHWSQLFNLKGNPIGWVLILAIFYLGITSIHLRAGVSGRIGK